MAIDMKSLAARGAQARLAELLQEIEEIRNAFPDLGRTQRGRPARSPSTAASANGDAHNSAEDDAANTALAQAARGKKKRTMSAEARARISAAQKKRWAAQNRTVKKG